MLLRLFLDYLSTEVFYLEWALLVLLDSEAKGEFTDILGYYLLLLLSIN
jgi:hypothetical protein